MPHVIVTTQEQNPKLLSDILTVLASHVPDDVVVVVDEVLISNRLTTDQSYANKKTAYVTIEHGGDFIDRETEEKIGAEITAKYPNYDVVVKWSLQRSWAANGKPA
jgi:hypothetical protein